MTTENSISKIGFSNIGGMFIGKDIASEFHKHYALTIILSFGEPFQLKTLCGFQGDYQFALIQKNIDFRITTPKDEHVAFIHVVPYTAEGMRLTDASQPIIKLNASKSQHSLALIKDWYRSDCNAQETVEHILQSIAMIPDISGKQQAIDHRILSALRLIMESGDEKLHADFIAKRVNLSVSHFNRLFKRETGLTFRRFVLHRKLIHSISAIHAHHSLTEASFIGGFSDQPHLTRTFKKNFGIKPSTLLK